ncbi:MAG: hypothetical protein A3G23_07320 [Bacteroidetes bacterium RIFCSPLOWO2_12_FULL_37_12]|nr:MAG: hypothetical protein A3G23_07320 [Bacteroidetes bacterium RIFCSPLOWO2_12_FULL_37_12]
MKKHIAILLIFFSINTFPQTDPMFTQYMYNTLFLNPGSAGFAHNSDSSIEIGNIARHQWVGIDGAPVSDILWFQSPFYPLNSGIGALLIYDKAGPLTSYAVNFDFSLHIKLGNGIMGIGPGLGMIANDLIGKMLKTNEIDPILPKGNVTDINYNLDAGIFYKNPWIFTGISALHILPEQTYNFSNYAGNKTVFQIPRHFYFITGFVINFDKRICMIPSFMVKTATSVVQSEISTIFYFNQKLNVGVSYRQLESVSFIVGYNFFGSSSLHIDYAYDRITNELRTVATHSHEFLVTWSIPVKRG